MRASLRTHLRLVGAGFRSQQRYLAAAAGGLVANTTFGILKSVILGATVAVGGGVVAGYDAGAMAAYIWIGQGLLGSVNLIGRTAIAERIRSGDVTVDFLRPLDIQTASIATEVGERLFSLIPRGIPAVLIGVLAAGATLPLSPVTLLIGALSLLLGITLSCAAVYLVAASGFWLVETRGVQSIYMVVSGFLAGLFVPIPLFPDWLIGVATASPFPSMLQYPIDLLTGRVHGAAAVSEIAQQVGWLTLLMVAGHLMTRTARRRMEVQGG